MNDYKSSPGNEYVARDAKAQPMCPFCGLSIERPREPDIRRPGEMPVGSCPCGAVYAYDATGHNLGSAFSEALVFGCNMDWDLAWNLLPEDDYLEELVKNYDIESNFIIPVGSYEGRRVSGALYFIRLQNDIQEVTRSGVQKKLDKSKPVIFGHKPSENLKTDRTYTKKEIEELVNKYQLELLLEASHDKKIIRYLQRLLYSGDELLRLKATDVLGRVCGIIAYQDPGTVSNLLQRLLTSVSNADYGASNWGAIDAIGEIISNSPNIYAGYTPTLYQFLESNTLLQPKVLRALGKIAQVKPELIDKSFSYFLKFLRDSEPQTRGYAVWLVGNLSTSKARLGDSEAKAELGRLLNDDKHEINIYANGHIEKMTIGQLATEAIAKLT